MKVNLVEITPNAENSIAYIARVSSPYQDNPNYAQLIKYLINHKHWSPFEHAHITVEIKTSRAISAQILRHWNARFQEFSQRYANVLDYETYEARRQDEKNRQNSLDDLPDHIKHEWLIRQRDNWDRSMDHYQWAVNNNIAKECARFVLPMQAATRLYMTADLRTWIHYINTRTDADTQLEHREIAERIKHIFTAHLPNVAEALGWK